MCNTEIIYWGFFLFPENIKTVERSDIACNAENIEVFLPQSLIHTTSSITWLDPNCSIAFNGTHFISKILHDQCGTTVSLTQSNVIFENKIIVHPFKTENSVLDFGTTPTEILVKCIYPRTEMTMSSYQPVKQQVRVYEKRFGHLNIDMRQYETNQFKHALNDLSTAREIELSSDIFISVGLPKRDTPGLGIHLDTCIATKTSTPYDNVFITLIENGQVELFENIFKIFINSAKNASNETLLDPFKQASLIFSSFRESCLI